MENNIFDFYERLSKGPVVLFLGQKLLNLNNDTNPLLSEINRKFPEKANASAIDYDNFLLNLNKNNLEYYLDWVREQCRRIAPPEWLETIGKFPWNSIYTSAVDPIWQRAFDLESREINPILEERFKPFDPRNQIRLHCTYLFGSLIRPNDSERSPLSKIELTVRKQAAITLAKRLNDIVTPFGTLIIEGYSNSNDWFNSELFFPILDKFGISQVHIFSSYLLDYEDDYFTELVKSGKLILHEESLATVLQKGESNGFIKNWDIIDDGEYQDRITINKGLSYLPLQIKAQIIRSGTILDDSIIKPPHNLSKEKLYLEFRDFHSQSSLKPNWSGFNHGFAFRRYFEKELTDKIRIALQSPGAIRKPLILQGQTGTGKTIAMGSIAFDLKKELKYPIIFIEKKTNRPNFRDISTFCQWAENEGADATIIFWDGMQEIDQYEELVNLLQSRGNQALVIGTSYFRLNASHQKDNIVTANAKFSSKELDDLKKFLTNFDPTLNGVLDKVTDKNSSNFLVALYRLLPFSRIRIQTGVIQEVGYAENEFTKKAQVQPIKKFNSVLGNALLKAGIVDSEELNLSEIITVSGEEISRIEEIIGLIMVPGSFGISVPIELLVRSIGNIQLTNLVKILNESDIFRWSEDEVGNIQIGPRQPLEAQLLLKSRFGNPKIEVEYAKKLLLEVREDDNSFENTELNFAIELVKSFGPNGVNPELYKRYFAQVSEILTQLREERGIINPRLMLQEAFLLREFVTGTNQNVDKSVEYLTKAEKILKTAISELSSDKKFNKLRSVLLTELASTIGAKIQILIDQNQNPQAFTDISIEIREYVIQARNLDPGRYHPFDVLLWTSNRLLRTGVLDSQTEIEIKAELFNSFDSVNVDELGNQKINFERRRMELGELLEIPDITDDAFQNLEAIKSSVGYYLRARQIIEEVDLKKPVTGSSIELCEKAYNYLHLSPDWVKQDVQCLYLMLRLWWLLNSGNPLFYKERQSLPFNRTAWLEVLGLTHSLISNGERYRISSLLYLQALAYFHVHDIQKAEDAFREIAQEPEESQGRRRVIRSYLASNPNGTPQLFNGQVRSAQPHKGEIYVEEIGRSIPFIPFDFGRPDIQPGDTIVKFHIAFNFIGMIADSTTRNRQKGE